MQYGVESNLGTDRYTMVQYGASNNQEKFGDQVVGTLQELCKIFTGGCGKAEDVS